MVKYRVTVEVGNFRRRVPEERNRRDRAASTPRPTGVWRGKKALPKISMQMGVAWSAGLAILVFGAAGPIARHLPLTMIDRAVRNTRVVQPRCQRKQQRGGKLVEGEEARLRESERG